MCKFTYGNILVETTFSPKRGTCMHAVNTDTDAEILFDIGGMDPNLVPDGTFGYFFGNKLILVTRWSDMTEEEMELVKTARLTLGIHPYECLQFSLQIGKVLTGVFITLPHCLKWLNREAEPVNEVVFIFTDTHDNDFLIARNAILPPFIAKRLQKANEDNHKRFNLDLFEPNYRRQASESELKDFYDVLYDRCFYEMADFYNAAVKQKYDIPDSLYLDIEDNTVINIREKEVEPEMSDEVKMYLRGAEQGIAMAQYNLGVCYETADGVEQDLQKAAYWYTKAAEQGYAKAQYNLGVCYYNGYGVEKNDEEALRLYMLAAEQGDMYAQFNTGVCYMQGVGCEADPFEAIEYLKKAASQGHPQATEFLKSIGLL